MLAGHKLENLYSIYILDLCFIMPAFIIVAALTIREKGIGYILTPAMFILGFSLIFSLPEAELIKLLFGKNVDFGSFAASFILSAVFWQWAFCIHRN
jgi:hypothetical protein